MPFSAKLCRLFPLLRGSRYCSAAEQPPSRKPSRSRRPRTSTIGLPTPAPPGSKRARCQAPKPSADLGNHHYAVTTSNAEAQRCFDQGLVFAYGFNHLEALRAFRHAQSLDPKCAMCFWGEAYVLGPNLNLPMDDAAAPVSRRAISRAAMLAEAATPKKKP